MSLSQIKIVATGLALTLVAGCIGQKTAHAETWQLELSENTPGSPLTLAQDLDSQNLDAPETEASTYIGVINRAQWAYRLENPKFTPQLDDLEVGIEAETEFYSYQILIASELQMVTFARPKDITLPSVVGIVSVGENRTHGIVCQSIKPNLAAPILLERRSEDEPIPDCPAGFEEPFKRRHQGT